MSNYTQITNFANKDTLTPGDANKKVKGAEINAEFVAISDAIETKADIASPTFTGTPAAPTATTGTNTTQVATTAFVEATMAGDATRNFTCNDLDVAGDLDITGTTTLSDGVYLKTWVAFSATGGTVTILSSQNVDSVVRSSTGIFTITYTTAIAAADYGVLLGGSAEAMRGPTGSYNVNDIDISTENDAGTEIDPAVVTMALVY
jgi:hypothetical protein